MENDVRGSQTGLWTTGWEPSFMNICSERCAAVKQSERVTLLCLSLTCVCVCVCLHSSVKEKLTADPDSEIATTSLRVSLLCPVNMTLFETFWQVQTRLFTLWSFFFFFNMFVTQHVLMCRTPPQMNDEWHNLNSLFPGPLSSVLCMRGFACFSSCNPSLIPVVSSSCPDILRFFFLFSLPCSWGRCDWWSHAGHWHAPTCSALMPHYTSRWTRRNPPGSVLSVTRRPRMNTSL